MRHELHTALATTLRRTALAFAATVCLHGSAARAAAPVCSLIRVTPCDALGQPAVQHAGGDYRLAVDLAVDANRHTPCSLLVWLAGRTYTYGLRSNWQGRYTTRIIVCFRVPLNGEIPYQVKVVPGGVRGRNAAHVPALTGLLRVEPPVAPVRYYDSQRLAGTIRVTTRMLPNCGSVSDGCCWIGAPISSSFQRVVACNAGPHASLFHTEPDRDLVWAQSWGHFAPSSRSDALALSERFTVVASSVAVNPDLLNRVSWRDVMAGNGDLKRYLVPDALLTAQSPSVARFAEAALRANYRARLTPYQAARTLYLAVVRTLTYAEPPPTKGDSLSVLSARRADCFGFSNLYAAALRSAGIPARVLSGWWAGVDRPHCLVEFLLPGCGWIPADPALDKVGWDPTGTYAYLFGSDPSLNEFCAVSRSSRHSTARFPGGDVQHGSYRYTGTAVVSSITTKCAIQVDHNFAAPHRRN